MPLVLSSGFFCGFCQVIHFLSVYNRIVRQGQGYCRTRGMFCSKCVSCVRFPSCCRCVHCVRNTLCVSCANYNSIFLPCHLQKRKILILLPFLKTSAIFNVSNMSIFKSTQTLTLKRHEKRALIAPLVLVIFAYIFVPFLHILNITLLLRMDDCHLHN